VTRDTTQALAQSKCGAQQACRLRATGRSTLRRLQRRGQGMHRDARLCIKLRKRTAEYRDLLVYVAAPFAPSGW
jgi:hypothetical protein